MNYIGKTRVTLGFSRFEVSVKTFCQNLLSEKIAYDISFDYKFIMCTQIFDAQILSHFTEHYNVWCIKKCSTMKKESTIYYYMKNELSTKIA